MKSNIKDKELQRIHRNAYRRTWYAQLSESKKEAARQKQKARYIENKKSQSSELAERVIETAEAQRTFTRYEINSVEHSFNAPEASEWQHVLPTTTISFKGKEPFGSEKSSHSLRSESVVHAMNQISPFGRVPQTHSGQTTRSITSCEVEHINMEVEATQLRERIYHKTSLNTGKRSRSAKNIGNATEYKSFDRTKDESEQGQHEDFLNSLTPKGLPPHILTLKPNCPVILLRNIDPPQGLSNGTRLICRTLTSNLIYGEIATGSHEGRKVFIPRIPLQPSDGKYPIPFVRKQFPVRLCFAMTINKAQGQTLETVGLYLPRPVFSHGQLYVALSRARTSSAIKIVIKPTYDDKSDYNCTENVVFREVLALAGI